LTSVKIENFTDFFRSQKKIEKPQCLAPCSQDLGEVADRAGGQVVVGHLVQQLVPEVEELVGLLEVMAVEQQVTHVEQLAAQVALEVAQVEQQVAQVALEVAQVEQQVAQVVLEAYCDLEVVGDPEDSENQSRRQMSSELAGLNPIELELWKAVRFPSDKFVDIAVVKCVPQVLFLHRKII